MTFLFDHEKKAFADHGSADAFVFQSDFQRKQLEPQLAPLGYDRSTDHRIRGAFDLDEWEFRPRPHGQNEPFVVGRPDADKWSSNTWRIYDRIAYRRRQALVMDLDERTLAKLGPPPLALNGIGGPASCGRWPSPRRSSSPCCTACFRSTGVA